MISLAVEGACAFAWRNYLLRHSSIGEDDSRRSALYRYITDLHGTGDYGFDNLQIAAVAYLKNLDKLHDGPTRESRGRQSFGRMLEVTLRTIRHRASALTPDRRQQHGRRDRQGKPFQAQ
jgi:hypothetical protein